MFTAKREDGRTTAVVVYELLREMAPGDVISHDDLCMALEVTDRRQIYPAVAGANSILRRNDDRHVAVVRTVGYRMLAANEHERAADAQMVMSRRRVERGFDILRHTRTDELTATEKRRHDAQLLCFVGLQGQIDVLAERVRALEDRDE